jgi:hypothetical protein
MMCATLAPHMLNPNSWLAYRPAGGSSNAQGMYSVYAPVFFECPRARTRFWVEAAKPPEDYIYKNLHYSRFARYTRMVSSCS